MEDALPLFEKAAQIARSPPTYLNYGMALEASVFFVESGVFGLGRDEASIAPPASGWCAALDTALEQYKAALALQPGCAHASF